MSGSAHRRGRGRPGQGVGPRRNATPTQARLLAVRVLERVERAGAYADLALHAALGRSALSVQDRAFVTELVYGTLRWRGHLDYLLGFALERDFDKLEPLVATLLRLGAYQLVVEDRVPVSAAVDQSVRCARALGADRSAGLVNAVLRRLAREASTLPLPGLEEDPLGHLTHALSLPGWIAQRWLERMGPREAARLASACNVRPPITLRTNPQRSDRETLLAELHERHSEVAPCVHAPLGIQLGRAGNPGQDPAFVAGRFTVQDEASQLVVALLDPQPGERILDLCAAPGTKTGALAERVGPSGEVVALDRNRRRLSLVARSCARLGLENVHCLGADASQPLPQAATGPFDRVLVDVPCSGLGTLRRNPDARWRLRPEDPARLARTQGALLARAATALRPGGTLVYSTCTLAPEENEAVTEAFLSRSEGAFAPALLAELPGPVRPFLDPTPVIPEQAGAGPMRTWQTSSSDDEAGVSMDGFFAQRMEKRS